MFYACILCRFIGHRRYHTSAAIICLFYPSIGVKNGRKIFCVSKVVFIFVCFARRAHRGKGRCILTRRRILRGFNRITMINIIKCDPCLTEREGESEKKADRRSEKVTPGTHPVCTHAITSNMGRLAVGPSFTMPCAHTKMCSVAALWRCHWRGWNWMRMVAWSVEGRRRDNEIVSEPKMLTLRPHSLTQSRCVCRLYSN